MKRHENAQIKGIFHHDKINRMKVYKCICLVSLFFRFVELCSPGNQRISFRLFSVFIYLKLRIYRKIATR